MSKIDIDKFVTSLILSSHGYLKIGTDELILALQDQGLYYHDGQIVTEIQKKLLDMSTPRSQEAIEKAEKRKEEREKKGIKMILHNGQEIEFDVEHLKGTDMDGGVKGKMGEQEMSEFEKQFEAYMYHPETDEKIMAACCKKLLELAKKQLMKEMVIPSVIHSIPYFPSCFEEGGACINPHHDCINCPKRNNTGGFITTTFNGTSNKE